MTSKKSLPSSILIALIICAALVLGAVAIITADGASTSSELAAAATSTPSFSFSMPPVPPPSKNLRFCLQLALLTDNGRKSSDTYCDANYNIYHLSANPVADMLKALAPPVVNTTVSSGSAASAPVLAMPCYDIYSPELVLSAGVLHLYFGGWLTAQDAPHDSIFLSNCTDPLGPCGTPRKVIDPTTNGLYQINDPSIVLHPASASTPAYYIMYMTGDTNANLNSNAIYYATSWATDGVSWSAPQLLIAGYWLPSATWRGDHVELYANSTTDGVVRVFQLGPSGLSVASPVALVFDNPSATPAYYSNVNVVWRQNINMYQMLAERLLSPSAGSSSVIDYLSSSDGVHWHLQYPAIITAASGQYRVGSPAQHPDSAFDVYFGSTAEQDSTGFHINAVQWSAPN